MTGHVRCENSTVSLMNNAAARIKTNQQAIQQQQHLVPTEWEFLWMCIKAIVYYKNIGLFLDAYIHAVNTILQKTCLHLYKWMLKCRKTMKL